MKTHDFVSLFIVGVAFLGLLVKHGSLRIPVCGESVAQLGVLCTREAFRYLLASAARRCCCRRRAQHAVSPPSSQPRRSTRELQRRLGSGYARGRVFPRRFGSTQGARRLPRRRPLANLPSCHPAAARRLTTRVLSCRRLERHAPDSCR